MNGMRLRGVAGILAVVLLAGLTLVACGGSGGSSPSPSLVIKTYSEADSGRTVTAKAGEQIRVTLKENPTTGYEWDMKLGPGLTLVSSKFIGPSPSPSPMIVGAGGTHDWLIRIDKPGTLTLTGIYARAWEAASKSAASFSLTIDAK